MLSRDVIDNIWQSGFCRRVTALSGRTEPGIGGSPDRIKIVEACLLAGCVDCYNATKLKTMERDVAELCGPEMLQRFYAHEDVADHPQFEHAFSARLRTALARHEITPVFMAWLDLKRTTRQHGYPYHNQDFGGIS